MLTSRTNDEIYKEFDEGHLKLDPLKAAEEVMDTLAVFDETHPLISAKQNPMRHTIQSVWLRFKKVSHVTLCD